MRKMIDRLVKTIQKILIVILLTVVYFLGFGITLLFVLIFSPRSIFGGRKKDQSTWINVEDQNENVAEDCMRAS